MKTTSTTTFSKILYADDDSDDRFFLSESLAAVGLKVDLVYANNGDEAINYLEAMGLQNILPSLIVLDLNMPKKNGKETLSYLKSHPTFATIPVVILSTSANKKDQDECARLGAISYFTKPNRYDDYLKIIETLQPYMS